MTEEKTSIVSLKQIASVTPKTENHPCIIIISGKGAGRLFKLKPGPSIIGRGTDAAIRLEDDGISRKHAQLILSEGKVTVEDLGSTNGTFINGEKVTSRLLDDGDKIELGGTAILKFSYADTIEEEYQRNLYDSATRDPLTGTYNKKFFIDRMATEFAYATRHSAILSICMLDIDHFKKVNDTYGHLAGDAILRHFAAAVQSQVRNEDIFCRYGGEEFALILRQTPTKEAFGLADRVRKTIETRICEHNGVKIPITCSIGLASHSGTDFADQQVFLKAADDALYKAKQGGRNRVVVAAAPTAPSDGPSGW
jgi:diguanylate cyclase (GGDEF)-like protein